LIKNIIILILAIMVWFAYIEEGYAAEQDNQYCDISSTTIITTDQDGNIINNQTEEKVVCNDGVKDFLQDMGIAKSCNYYTWQMPLGGTLITHRSVACERLDGGYEIIPNYSGLD
tara:strand:+ start:300 stop:644 length:345 start_codon:yes stop_codon:yes gene_type:complete